jgi:hypothetical protein
MGDDPQPFEIMIVAEHLTPARTTVIRLLPGLSLTNGQVEPDG